MPREGTSIAAPILMRSIRTTLHRPPPGASILAATLVMAAVLGAACGGGGGGEDGQTSSGGPGPTPGTDVPRANDATTASALSGSRRLTVHEYNRILHDVLHDDVGLKTARIEDTKTGFDNDVTAQAPASAVYVEETETAAIDAAKRFVATDVIWSGLAGCTPTGAADADCLRKFIARAGRRLLRHTMTPEQTTRYVAAIQPFAIEKNDFRVAIQLTVQALLQELEFLYVVQTTRPLAGRPDVVALNGTSRAAALSLFLLGTTPDDALLDEAESGKLDSPAHVAEVAAALLEDPRSRPQLDRFVAMWFGYEKNPALTPELADEMNHVVERAVFTQDADILTLLTSKDTYLPNDALADAYNLPHPPPGGGWVPYGDSGRAGILSTGAVLTMGAKGTDTSPTQRGKAILEKVLCSPMARPANVNVDQPPAAPDNSPCKVARYKAIAATGPQCAACHATLDGLGFGLEKFDLHGKLREHDDGLPACAIPGDGELPGRGTFRGPGELGALLLKTDKVGSCVVKQVFRYGFGRADLAGDEASIAALDTEFDASHRSMKKLLVAVVSSNAFLTAKQ